MLTRLGDGEEGREGVRRYVVEKESEREGGVREGGRKEEETLVPPA